MLLPDCATLNCAAKVRWRLSRRPRTSTHPDALHHPAAAITPPCACAQIVVVHVSSAEDRLRSRCCQYKNGAFDGCPSNSKAKQFNLAHVAADRLIERMSEPRTVGLHNAPILRNVRDEAILSRWASAADYVPVVMRNRFGKLAILRAPMNEREFRRPVSCGGDQWQSCSFSTDAVMDRPGAGVPEGYFPYSFCPPSFPDCLISAGRSRRCKTCCESAPRRRSIRRRVFALYL